MPKQVRPFKLFISYAHKDEAFKDEIAVRLKPLERAGFIDKWDDREILPGQDWDADIKNEMESADIILFLVSPYFMASDYIHDFEIAAALEKHKKGEQIIVPVIIRPIDLSLLEISKFQALPKNAKAISLWQNEDEAWLDVAKGIKNVVLNLEKGQGEIKKPNVETNDTLVSDASPQSSRVDGMNLKAMVGEGRTEKVIEILLGNADQATKDFQNELILISSRFRRLQEDEMMGTLEDSKLSIARNKINRALMYLIDKI